MRLFSKQFLLLSILSLSSFGANANTRPVVTLNSPSNGATVALGVPVLIQATASDVDGSVARVEFYINGSLAYTDTSPPYQFSPTPTVAATYRVFARAIDNLAASRVSATATVTAADNQAPTVSLVSPANGSKLIVGKPVTIKANASDSDGSISRVEFYIDGALAYTDTSAPYEVTTTPTVPATHQAYVRAYDNSGASTSSSMVSVTVVAENKPPSVALTSPANGSTLLAGNPVTIKASASDSDGSISRVEFYIDGALAYTDTSAPYEVTATPTEPATHRVYVRAFDDEGLSANSSEFTVSVTTENQPPSVNITAPTDGSEVIVGTPVEVRADVTDDDGYVTRVEFYVDGNLVATDDSSPFTVTLTPDQPSEYVLHARAYDNSGLSTQSAAARVLALNSTTKNTITYYHSDLNGSPIGATDENGNLLWRAQYQPFGERREEDGTAVGDKRRGFTGHLQDDDLGLVYMQARYYDPLIGRFFGSENRNPSYQQNQNEASVDGEGWLRRAAKSSHTERSHESIAE